MALVPVHFEYLTGLRRSFLVSARLTGSWNAQGFASEQWSFTTMQPFTAEDGCPAFRATVQLDDSQVGQTFRWGVSVGTPDRPDVWGIASEINDAASTERNRTFTLRASNQTESYYLTHCRRLGANKLMVNGQTAIRFAVWAPNARNAELVQGERAGGYIWNDGRGVVATIPMHRGEDGIWSTDVADAVALADFGNFDHQPYMFRITREDGSVAYRTDLYSRCQIGSGGKNPEWPRQGEAPWNGTQQDLDGSKSCSVVIDPEQVGELFDEGVWPETRWRPEDDFWRDEFDPNRPLPSRIEDIVIYELHVDGLGLERGAAVGTLKDALNLIPYLRDLGVNCVQLMPMSEFQDRSGWGYAVEYAGGGRDTFKHFVRECHRDGIAVILDVVYNHFTFYAERAQWAYDSNAPENNIYYWYEGRASDYAQPDCGYVDNGSIGWAPRFWAEMVRKMFVSSAAALASEFHFDGFRVDLTQAIHRDNVRHADGRSVGSANQFGQKFLREWSNTLRLIRPTSFLIAEDHTGWRAVYQPTDQGGLGFDAVEHSKFCNHLIGDSIASASDDARLIEHAGRGGNEPLLMDRFAEIISATTQEQVIFTESRDTARTMLQASGGAALISETRRTAEALCRVACGLLLLVRGTPMFFMGQEVGASLPYRSDNLRAGRETRDDLEGQRAGPGRMLFRFYGDMIRFRLLYEAFRSSNIETIYANNADRVLAFRRRAEGGDFIVLASLNNAPFTSGYRIHHDRLRDGEWQEVVNSNAKVYGGNGLGSQGIVQTAGGTLTACIPARAFIVLQRLGHD